MSGELARRDGGVYPTPPARHDTDSWTQIVGEVASLASKIADTAFVPKGLRGSAPATAAAILYGREVGLAPMASLGMTDVIEGRPALRAEAMRALILAAGHDIEVAESTGAVCTIRGRRRGSETWTPVTWSLDMARAAGLAGRGPWKTYPRAMLQARATTELARLVFPDVIHGFRSVEELEDAGATTTTGQPAAGRERKTVQRGQKRETEHKSLPAAPAPPAAGEELPPLPDEDTTVPRGDVPPPDTSTPQDPPNEAPSEPPSGASADEEPPDPTTVPAGRRGSSSPPKPMSSSQKRMLFAQLNTLGVDSKGELRRHIAGAILEREVPSFNELTTADAKTLLDTLARFDTGTDLTTFLDTLTAQTAEETPDHE